MLVETPQPLPTGTAPVEPTPENTLDSAIEKAKAEIAATQAAPIVKRGRGRPRKIRPEPAAPSLAQPAAAAVPQFDATPYLKQAVQLPASILATNLKCDELRVTDAEAAPVVSALDNFIRVYAPNLEKADPKTIAACTLAFAVGALAFEKYSVYAAVTARPKTLPASEVQSEVNMPSNQPIQETHAPAESLSGRVPAAEAFRARRAGDGWANHAL